MGVYSEMDIDRQALEAAVIDDAIVGLPPVGRAYATAVFVYLCRADRVDGCECALTVAPWADPSFESVVIP